MGKLVGRMIFLAICTVLFLSGVIASIVLVNGAAGYYAFVPMSICIIGFLFTVILIVETIRGDYDKV